MNPPRLVPLRRYTLHLDGSPTDLFSLLCREIGEEGPSGGHAPAAYLGRVSGENFEIRRINAYRSAFMPLIQGRYSALPEGTEVRLAMRPHREVFIFSALWYTFLALVTLLIVLTAGDGRLYRLLFCAVPLGLALSSWLLTVTVFESDCRWARESLDERIFSRLGIRPSGGAGR